MPRENPMRVATAALSGRIFAGRATKDGKRLKEPRHDVTSDVLRAVRDKVGIGHRITVECDGEPVFYITVTAIENERCGDAPFVQGPTFETTYESDEGDRIWSSEVQMIGGHSVVAEVFAGSADEAAERGRAVTEALNNLATRKENSNVE